MNPKKWILGFLLLGIFMFLNADIQEDAPARGKYVFPLEKIWETDMAGEQPLGNVTNIWIADDGTVYCYDRKNFKYYIFESNGSLLRAFGKKGEGPGEIRRIEQAPLYLINRTLIILDTGKLHYFDHTGNYLKSLVYSQRGRPNLFLNENEFIVSPRTILDIPQGKGAIRKVNLVTKKREIIKEFDIFKGGAISDQNIQAAMVIPTLTPLMIINIHQNRLYYGMSNHYRMNICDMSGKDKGFFGVKRKKNSISDEVKIDQILSLAKGRAPEELLRTLALKLPNQETYFYQMRIHNGLIYLYNSHFDRQNIQKIDIFSLEGKYLYRAMVRTDENLTIRSGPVFKGNALYLALENEDGDILLGKYKTRYPE